MKSKNQQQLLIFPSSTAASLEFLEWSRSIGELVQGASSVRNDPNATLYDEWTWLPQITDVDFLTKFFNLLALHNISRVFCPLPVAHKYLERIFSDHNIDCILLPSPFDSELARYKKLDGRAIRAIALAKDIVDADIRFSKSEVKSVLNYTDTVWGQCGELKLSALIAVMSNAPKGDVVEIGAFLGKSASALTMLANWRQTGNVIAIDPWTVDNAVQTDAPDYVQELARGSYWDTIFEQFIINLAPIANGTFNYIRGAAKDARRHYGTGEIHSKEFGAIICTGQIAVLHIDGNHDYEAVAVDAQLWLPLVSPNGWVIFDDYLWAHGSGPKRVGDRVLTQYSSAIDQGFVCDGALFIKFGSSKVVSGGMSD